MRRLRRATSPSAGAEPTHSSTRLPSRHGRHHNLPRRQFPEADRTSADTLANIAFITSEVNKSISHSGPEVYLEEVKPAYLASQCIPDESALWRIKRADDFFASRRELLAEAFNEFVRASLPGRRL